MISLEEAQSRLLALAPTPTPEIVPVADALGRYTMADLLALRDQPENDLSAMDGYAVAGKGPWTLVGESAAGTPGPKAISAGTAVRIFTGAIVPGGADCVIMQEDMQIGDAMVSLSAGQSLVLGRHIRPKCGDFAIGNCLIPSGTKVSASHIGLAIASGHDALTVAKPVRIAILSTGNELVAPGSKAGPGQIPASNGLMLKALLDAPGVIVTDQGIVPDDLGATMTALGSAQADIILTIGGASVGDHDLVRPALLALGADIDFWKVAMKPGKPLMAGNLGDAIVLGLPGNPVSAFVTGLLFARPLIAACSGNPSPLPTYRNRTLGADLPANGNRMDHIRARMINEQVVPIGVNDSAALLALSQATHLIRRPAGADRANAGESVDVLDLA